MKPARVVVTIGLATAILVANGQLFAQEVPGPTNASDLASPSTTLTPEETKTTSVTTDIPTDIPTAPNPVLPTDSVPLVEPVSLTAPVPLTESIPLTEPVAAAEPTPAGPPSSDIELTVGIALPQGSYSTMPLTVSGAFIMPVTENLKLGPVFRYTSGLAKEDVAFPSTGNTETRIYKVSSYFAGAELKFPISSQFLVIGQTGAGYTEATLQSVDTTAPVASSLTTGSKRATFDFGYSAAFRYEYEVKKFSFGAELGYLTTAASEATAFKGMFLVASVVYRLGNAELISNDSWQKNSSTSVRVP